MATLEICPVAAPPEWNIGAVVCIETAAWQYEIDVPVSLSRQT